MKEFYQSFTKFMYYGITFVYMYIFTGRIKATMIHGFAIMYEPNKYIITIEFIIAFVITVIMSAIVFRSGYRFYSNMINRLNDRYSQKLKNYPKRSD